MSTTYQHIQNQIKKLVHFFILMNVLIFMICTTIYAGNETALPENSQTVILDDLPVTLTLSGFDIIVTRTNAEEITDVFNNLGLNVDEYLEEMKMMDIYANAWDDNYSKEFYLSRRYYDGTGTVSFNGFSDEEIEKEMSKVIQNSNDQEDMEIHEGEVYHSVSGDKYYLSKFTIEESDMSYVSYQMLTVRLNNVYYFSLASYNDADLTQELKEIVNNVVYSDELAENPSKADSTKHSLSSTKIWTGGAVTVFAATIAGILGGRARKKRNAKKAAKEAAMKEQNPNTEYFDKEEGTGNGDHL